ncbi:MAG: lysophospholipid acyltransferase family protein [Gammaproteobacteria bacterium]|nr:lysophospholipid acyltransferase family protein [Gammaproteobacteria bacterium]
MAENNPAPDYSNVEMRRSKRSSRRMSAGRRLAYAIATPLLRAALFLLNSSYRVKKIIGSEIADRIVADSDQAYVPCYWHQQHIVCSYLMRDWLRRGFKASYIVSASVDGEVPARIVRSWRAGVIRGSTADAGALVLRDAQQVMKRGVSVVVTSDGPLGPKFEFKTGTVLMARVGRAPLVPVACAADRAWYLNSWDRFMIPKPFAHIAIAVGEPIDVPRDASMGEMEAIRAKTQSAIDALIQASKAAVVEAT